MQATKTAEAMAQPSVHGVISWGSQAKKSTEDEILCFLGCVDH
jgi:hypothetical protein